jgi:hypothetical protein
MWCHSILLLLLMFLRWQLLGGQPLPLPVLAA